MQQLWDEFERNKLARETRRGMREGTEQGYRMGGVAPYGYQREQHAMPDGHRGDTDKNRVKLVPIPERAPVVAEIFHLHADKGWSPKAIADHLNRPGGPPPPSHTSIPAATAAATGPPALFARCSATRSTPAASSGTAWTSPQPARTEADHACALRSSGLSPRTPTCP